MEIGEVERHLLSLVMAVGRAALEEFVAVKGTGYAGKEIDDAQGNRCPYVRDRDVHYRSIFGTISIRRAYYHATGSPGVFPLDGELNLPERGYSYLVQEFSSRLAVTMSYEDAQEILRSFFPVRMPIRSLESIVGDVCDEVDRFYAEKAPPDVCPEAVVTVATVDKKGVVIRKPQEGEAGPESGLRRSRQARKEEDGNRDLHLCHSTLRPHCRTTSSRRYRTRGVPIPGPNPRTSLHGAASPTVRKRRWPA